MKRINNVWREKITFSNLLQAHYRARKGKRFRAEVIRFEMNLEDNLIRMGEELLRGDYKFSKYREFYVFEPKKRCIKVLKYRDRVVHQFYVEEYIKPIFLKNFIKDSYACIKGKGVHQAVDTLQRYMKCMKKKNEHFYILKCDIHKFFYNVNHKKLYECIRRKCKDKEFLAFSRKLIFCDNTGKGLPIGNYTSQFFANIYLTQLDKFVKEVLGIKYYVRYMDDFVLLLNSKTDCRRAMADMERFLLDIDLCLNPKTTYMKNADGVNFCGYKVFCEYKKIRRKNKIRLKRWLKKIIRLYALGKIEIESIGRKVPALRGPMVHCNGFRMYEKLIGEFVLVRGSGEDEAR